MPTYDLKCEGCEHEFEVNHPISEPHPEKCPQCGKKKLQQAWKKTAAYHAHYSPMHPRLHRGRGF